MQLAPGLVWPAPPNTLPYWDQEIYGPIRPNSERNIKRIQAFDSVKQEILNVLLTANVPFVFTLLLKREDKMEDSFPVVYVGVPDVEAVDSSKLRQIVQAVGLELDVYIDYPVFNTKESPNFWEYKKYPDQVDIGASLGTLNDLQSVMSLGGYFIDTVTQKVYGLSCSSMDLSGETIIHPAHRDILDQLDNDIRLAEIRLERGVKPIPILEETKVKLASLKEQKETYMASPVSNEFGTVVHQKNMGLFHWFLFSANGTLLFFNTDRSKDREKYSAPWSR
jgi:hypothetical protein